MSYQTCMYVTYFDGHDNEIPLSREPMVSFFDPYIPGDPGVGVDERFCELDSLAFDELPVFLREEYGEGSGRMFAEIRLADFSQAHSGAVDSCMKRVVTVLEALGMDVGDEPTAWDLHVENGRYDENGNKNPDYSQLTWPVDKTLVTKMTGKWNDMAIGIEAMGIFRVIRDMVPMEVKSSNIRLIVVRS